MKKTICVDFDGVIHSYDSGWHGEGIVPDDPVPGALEWLEDISWVFNVVIVSSRAKSDIGKQAIWDALVRWYIRRDGEFPHWIHNNNRLKVKGTKVPASVYIDDRAIRFDGDFNKLTVLELDEFTPWNKR